MDRLCGPLRVSILRSLKLEFDGVTVAMSMNEPQSEKRATPDSMSTLPEWKPRSKAVRLLRLKGSPVAAQRSSWVYSLVSRSGAATTGTARLETRTAQVQPKCLTVKDIVLSGMAPRENE